VPLTPYPQAGVLCLTTHRLVWLAPPGSTCSACGLGLCCVAEAKPKALRLLGSRTPRLVLRLFVDAAGAAVSGAHAASRLLQRSLRLSAQDLRLAQPHSFSPSGALPLRVRRPAQLHSTLDRGAPAEELLPALQAALSRRAWAQNPPPSATEPARPAAASSPPGSAPGSGGLSAADAGVSGILRRQQAAQRVLGRSLDEAFTDLSALMEKAKEMMAFAERTRAAMLRDQGEASAELEARHTAGLVVTVPTLTRPLPPAPGMHAEPGHREPRDAADGRGAVPPAALAAAG